MILTRSFTILTILLGLSMTHTAQTGDTTFRIEKTLEISRVPAGFPVGFCLLTHKKKQYVAYYDKDRQMTVASQSIQDRLQRASGAAGKLRLLQGQRPHQGHC